MKLQKKNNSEVYEVADPSWFEQYTEIASEADDNGSVYDFLLEQVEGTEIEEDYKSWLNEHFDDYYFTVQKSKDSDDYYAVAYESYNYAAYAIQIEDINE